MSSQIDRYAPTTIHTLDVAFSSDAKPLHSGQPIAMAYGFAYGPAPNAVLITAAGQTKDTMNLYQQVYFKIFDTAQKAATVSKVSITFEDNKSPFSWPSRSFPGDEDLPRYYNFLLGTDATAWSHGCNVIGRCWLCGPYQVVNPGDFECTVWVWVKTANGEDKVFNVDPEMVIKGN